LTNGGTSTTNTDVETYQEKSRDTMNRNQIGIMSVLALLGGFIGGFVSTQLEVNGRAFAQQSKVQKVIEANEFRLVDAGGTQIASFGAESGPFSLEEEPLLVLGRELLTGFPPGQREKIELRPSTMDSCPMEKACG